MTTVPLATFNELEPAQKLQGRLQQAGIPATIHDESKVERFGFMSEPLASIHLEVPQPKYLAARKLVEDWDKADGALHSAVRCPECESSRVEFPQMTRKFITPALGSLLMALRLIKRQFYCLDCHYTWPLAVPLKPKLDVLGWPTDSKLWHPENQSKGQRAP
jgi:hypothetical protein